MKKITLNLSLQKQWGDPGPPWPLTQATTEPWESKNIQCIFPSLEEPELQRDD